MVTEIGEREWRGTLAQRQMSDVNSCCTVLSIRDITNNNGEKMAYSLGTFGYKEQNPFKPIRVRKHPHHKDTG